MTRVLIVAADQTTVDRITRVLGSTRGAQIQVWPGSLTALGTVEAIGARMPDLIVIGPDATTDELFDAATRLEQTAPSATVVVITTPDPLVWRRALEAGVRSVIDPESSSGDMREGLVTALESARRRSTISHDGTSHRVIVVASPKGGVGKTMLATNLGIALRARSNAGVAVVDLDLEFGDVAHDMMMTPQHSMADAVAALPDLDLTALKVYLTTHHSGVCALTAPDDVVEAGEITPDQSSAIVDLLTAEFRYVIVDTASGMNEHALSVMEHATDLIVLSDMDIPSVQSVRKAISLLDVLEITEHRRHFVLNRADSRVGLQVNEVAAAAGMPVDIRIPSSRLVPISINEGRPIFLSRPRSPVSRRIADLAGRLDKVPIDSSIQDETSAPATATTAGRTHHESQ